MKIVATSINVSHTYRQMAFQLYTRHTHSYLLPIKASKHRFSNKHHVTTVIGFKTTANNKS